jgi:hypothetical protein
LGHVKISMVGGLLIEAYVFCLLAMSRVVWRFIP